MKYHIFVSATEVSADIIGAKFVESIQRNYPNTFFFSGWGGPKLKSQGVNVIGDVCSTNSVGITEAFPFFFSIIRFLRISKKFLRENFIDGVLCIDGQGKNIPLSKIAKKMGIKVIYILPPPIFIWGTWLKKRLSHIDLIGCLFYPNFQIFSRIHHNVIFLKHPLLFTNKKTTNYNQRSVIIGLFPGSRRSEIQRLLPDMIEILKLLRRNIPGLEAVLCVSHSSFLRMIKGLIPVDLKVRIISGDVDDILQRCKVAILASGTITLQALKSYTPSVVIYRLSFLSSFIARIFLKTKFFSLPNILLNNLVFPEFFNSKISYEEISRILLPYLEGSKDNLFLVKYYKNLKRSVDFKSKKIDFFSQSLLKELQMVV